MTVRRRYELWLDRDGRPSVVRLDSDLSPDEFKAVVKVIEEVTNVNGVLFLGPEWEVRR
jgi:hypothetical protein